MTRQIYEAVTWMQSLFGPYVWPQLTFSQRIERSGTEFPMLVMQASASEGLTVHEVVHQWVHGILANNEFAEAWLDEGFADFLTAWYFEAKGNNTIWPRMVERQAERERAGRAQPVATPAAEFVDFSTYNAITYGKAAVVFYMLREMVGEEAFRRILRTYYERNRLQHVTEEDFRAAAEEVTGRDLGWFFHQWLHTTDTLDYGVGDVRTARLPDGRWRTRVEVLRLGDAWMPVTLRVDGETRTLESRERRQVVEVTTSARPSEVVLDPEMELLDIDRTNNRAVVP